MKLTVIQRVSGGFAVITLLLILLSISSFQAISSINHDMETVTEEATPLVVASGDTIADILAAGNTIASFHNSRNIAQLKSLKKEYSEFEAKYKNNILTLKSLSEIHTEVAKAVASADINHQSYLKTAQELFNVHQKSVELDLQIAENSSTFEDNADELDSALLDIEDSSNKTSSKLAVSLNQTIQNATVTVTDGLLFNSIVSLQTTINEQQGLEESINQDFQKLQKYTSTDNLTEFMLPFIEAIGRDGILQQHKSRLVYDQNSAKLFNQLEESLSKSVKLLRKVSNLANQLALDAKQQASGAVSFNLTLIVVLSLIAIVIAAGIGYWVAQSIRKPLEQIADVFSKVSAGDMTQTVNIRTEDEFGQLGNWINDLVSNLREMMAEISLNSEQLSAAAEETSAITLQTQAGVDQQKDQINQIATAMSEMAATVEDVASSANRTMEEVNKASKQSNHGSEIVQKTRETILHLSKEIDSAGQVINQLDEHSSNIGAILDVIRGIADQTNLLALNAAIEAARAGEHGRGFSVVADEVRTLASKTQESTSDIQHMIEELQQGTQQAVSVMDNSRAEANECVEKSDAASEALNTITDAVQAINDMSVHIAQAAKEQNTVTQEMHRNIESISEISEQTALGAGQTAEASHEQSNLANQLQRLVGKFKT